jgi:hypothetical protein
MWTPTKDSEIWWVSTFFSVKASFGGTAEDELSRSGVRIPGANPEKACETEDPQQHSEYISAAISVACSKYPRSLFAGIF